MTGEGRCWVATAMVLLTVLATSSPLLAAAVDPGAPAPGRRLVFSEGFESDGKMTFWASDASYKVNFAGPTEERAASGKRSFKIDLTWIDCRYNYWWAPVMIPYYGNPVVRGKLYVERGGATLGHAYAVPEGRTSGNVVEGAQVGALPDGWTQWRSSALGTPGEATYLQGVAVYLSPDEERRTVVYVDDLEVEATLPDGYEAELKARIAEVEAEWNAPVQKAARTLPARFAELAAEIDAVRPGFPASASPALKECWQRLCQYRDQVRSKLETQLAQLQAEPTSSAVASARQLLALLEKTHASCLSLAPYAAAHPSAPYVVWIVDPISDEKVLPERFPVPGIVGTELSVSACRGEYEPASFALQAIKELRDVTVECSDAEAGEFALPSSQIDIHIVKCWWQAGVGVSDVRNPTLTPELLLKDPDFVLVDDERKCNVLEDPEVPVDASELQPVTIPAGTTQQFWITVRVPEDMPPGRYVSSVRVNPQNAPEMILPLEVEVLPFTLEEPALRYSIYYRGTLREDGARSIGSESKSPQQYLAEMRNLKAHGVTHPTCYQGFGPLLDSAIELRKQAGIAVDPFYSLGIGTGAPASPEELEALKERVRSGLAQVRGHGIDELYIYGIDEASGERLKAEREAFRAAHEAGAKVFVACSVGTFEMVGDLLDMANCSHTPFPGEAEKWHRAGHSIFNYANPQVGEERPETYRRNYGLLLWKAGYDGAMDYAYQHGFGDIYVDDDGTYRDHVFAYPTVDGVIDTIQWEGFREGVDDVRYLTTLLKAIQRAKTDEARAAQAREVERWVEEMEVAGDLRALRAEMVEWILALSE